MKPWREACEAAVREFSREDALRFWRVGHQVEGREQPIFDYRFEHTLATVKLARWLAPQVGADLDVVEAAAWLHDCRKRLKDPRSRDHHAQEGAETASEVLSATDFPSGKLEAVRHAILHHVGLRLEKRLEPIETACLWDADKLSKIGAASLVHFSCISGAFQPISTAEILQRGEGWLSLAQGIADSMNTDPARLEAKHRLAFLRQHYAQLRREWVEPLEGPEP